MVYNPDNRPNKFNKSITVTSNASNNPVKLKIIGNVIPTPNKLRASIGKLRIDKTKITLKKLLNTEIQTGEIKLHSTFNLPVHVKFDYNLPYLTIEPDELYLNPDERITLSYSFDATIKNEYGNFLEKIPVSCTTESESKKGFVYFSGTINEDFSYLTEEEMKSAPHIKLNSYVIDLGEIDIKSEKPVEISVKNTGQSDLQIRKIETSRYCELDEYSEIIAPNSEGLIVLKINPYTSRKNFNTDFSIFCNDPEKPIVKVRISGKIKK